MRIESIQMRNFLSFGDSHSGLTFNKFNTIVGSNNSGKTNIFRAISFVHDCLVNSSTHPDPFYYKSDLTKDLEIQVGVELNNDEIKIFSDLLYCSILTESPNRRDKEREGQSYRLLEKFLDKYLPKITNELFRNFTVIIKRKETRDIYRGDALIKLGKGQNPLFLINHNDVTRNPSSKRGGAGTGSTILEAIRNKNKTKVDEFLINEIEELPEFEFLEEEIKGFFKKINPNDKDAVYDLGTVRFNEGNLREKNYPQQIRLLEFFGGNSHSTRQESVLDLISKLFERSLIRTANLRSTPRSFLSLQNSIQTPTIDMKDLSGETLPEILFQLRNSTKPDIRKKYNDIQNEFKKMCNDLEFDIGIRPREITIENENKYDSITGVSTKQRFQTTVGEKGDESKIENELVLQFVKGNITIPVEYSAAGLFEILLLLTALIGQEGKIILLDEPAVNLHPSLQRQILEKIEKEIVRKNKNQVIMITHSPYLINPLNTDGIWRIYSSKVGSGIVNVGKALCDMKTKEKERIKKSLQYSDIRSIFFSNGIILVEGLSDKLVIEQIDRHLITRQQGMQLDEHDWYVIEMVGGKHSLWTYIKMAKQLHIPYLSVMDYDALMHCDKKEKIENKLTPISAIFRSLLLVKELRNSDLETISKEVQKIENEWYPQSEFNKLNSISQENHCFVFSKDLEGVLQNSIKHRESKPLKNLNVILEKIKLDKIPPEFLTMVDFIKKDMNSR